MMPPAPYAAMAGPEAAAPPPDTPAVGSVVPPTAPSVPEDAKSSGKLQCCL